jgi:enoyl-CoA hydratase/carnithine racemase
VKYEESSFEWEVDDGSPAGAVADRATVAFSLDDAGVATVLLNRPEHRNTINSQVLHDLSEVLRVCDRTADIRVVVLSGAGAVFCTGSELSADGSFGGEQVDAPPPVWMSPYQLRKPVIAAINGHAVGAGLTLAMQCDIRIVATDAKLSLPFTKLGVIGEWMGHWTAVRYLGIARAAELFFTGRLFSGADAESWGLANTAVPAADVMATALAMAHQIALNAPVSLAITKRLLWEAVTADRGRSGDDEHRLLDVILDRPDAAEGGRAFLEKRAPSWLGSTATDLPGWPA